MAIIQSQKSLNSFYSSHISLQKSYQSTRSSFQHLPTFYWIFRTPDFKEEKLLDEDADQKEEELFNKMKDIDRGWAWVALFGSFMAHVFLFGIGWTVGIFYMVFLKAFNHNEETTESNTSWIATLNTSCIYFGALISSIITNKYGSQVSIVVGTLMASTGLILSSFAKGIFFLYATFGICTGLGIGIAYLPSIAAVALYFDKCRNVAMGLAVSGVSMGTVVYPPLIRILIENYHWRGALIILAAINLNMLVVAAILRPPDYQNLEQRENIKTVAASVDSIAKSQETKPSIFNWRLFRNIEFLILCLNNVLFLFGMSIVYLFLIAYASSLGFNNEKSVMLLSVVGIANLVGRVAIGFVAQHPRVNVVGLYCVSIITVGFLTLLCTQIKYYPGLLVYSVLFGLFSAALGTLLPLVIVNIVGLAQMASALGCVLIFEGIGFLVGGPMGGWILHLFGHNYDAVFFLGGGAIVISGFVMVISWNRATKPWDLSVLEQGPFYQETSLQENIEAVISTV